MEHEIKSIHDFDFTFICDYFKSIPRQGPGSPEVTRIAAGFIGQLTDDALIADLGCGTGGQTMTLARSVKGQITGIDLFPDFIDLFNRNAEAEGLSDRVRGITGSMDDLPFAESSLDLIWSEGAIYNIGFADGLALWNRYLKPGGYVAVSEGTWFTTERPQEIEDFWMDAYPGIDTIANKVDAMQRAGYLPVAHFVEPEECWTENYFKAHDAIRDEYLASHAGNKSAADLVANQQREEKLYGKYKEYYGYVFYIGKKI